MPQKNSVFILCIFNLLFQQKKTYCFFSQYHHMLGKQGQIFMDKQMSL